MHNSCMANIGHARKWGRVFLDYSRSASQASVFKRGPHSAAKKRRPRFLTHKPFLPSCTCCMGAHFVRLHRRWHRKLRIEDFATSLTMLAEAQAAVERRTRQCMMAFPMTMVVQTSPITYKDWAEARPNVTMSKKQDVPTCSVPTSTLVTRTDDDHGSPALLSSDGSASSPLYPSWSAGISGTLLCPWQQHLYVCFDLFREESDYYS
jgi:hypothetical protein